MKNLLLLAFCFLTILVYGQVPEQINYQGIARNSVGNVIPNKRITIRLSIRDNNGDGPVLYSETRKITTNNFGLFNLAIGSPGADLTSGTIKSIDWSNVAKFIKVEIDPEGGSNFINMGAAQLLSVPYALYAGTAAIATPSGPAGGVLTGNYPNPSISNGAITQSMIANGVIPTTLPPSGTAGGDLTGTYPNPIVNDAAITTNKLADNSVSTSKIIDASVTGAKLAPGVIPTTLPPNGAAGGDLSGTYPNPTINDAAITTNKLADNSVTTSKINDASVTNSKLGDDAVGTSKIIDASVTSAKLAAGVIPTTLPPNGAAGGDLSGTYPNPTINDAAITTNKLADNAVTTSKVNDASVTNSKLADNAVSTSKIIDASVTGAKLAPGVIPATLPPSGAAGGDLTGTYPNPIVNDAAITTNKLADNAVSTSKVNDASVTNSKLADNAVSTSKIIDASVTGAKLAPGVIPATLPPNGAAGGDLSGTYPNPTINDAAITTNKLADNAVTTSKINDASVTNSKLADDAVGTSKIIDASVTSAKLAAGVIPTTLPPSGAAGGDLSGTYPNPLLDKIQGVPVSNALPTIGQVLKYDGTQWLPGTDNGGSGSTPSGPAGGDLSGTYPNPNIAAGAITVSKIANGAVNTPKLADGSVTTNKILDLAVTTTKLDDNSVSTNKIIDGAVTGAKLAPGLIPSSLPPSGAAGGDLTGTYPNPIINNSAITTTKLADNSVTTSKITDASVTSAKLAAGVIPTSLPPSGAAGGDLTGTYPNPTINNSAITTTKLADNSVTTLKITDASVTSAKLAPGVIPTSLPPNGAAGGDLTGTYPNPIVTKLQGVSVNNTLPLSGQVLKFDGTQWIPGTDNGGSPTGVAGGDLTGTYPNPTIADAAITSTKLADNSVGTLKIIDASVTSAKLAPGIIPTTLPPSGAAGGDLSGTYPNPTVNNSAITSTKLADNAVTTLKIADASVTSAKLAAGVIPTSLPPNGAAGGDLTGTYPNPIVTKLQGVSVNNTLPLSGQVLKFDGTQWIPGTDNGGSPTGAAGGDLTGTYPNPTIADAAITSTKLADNSVSTLKIIDASVTSAKLAPGIIPTTLPPSGAAGGDLSGTYPNPTVNNSAITTIKLADNSVTTSKITDASVTSAKLAAGVIPTTLPPSGVAGGDLTGTYPNPTIADAAVISTKLADNSVGTSKISDASVTSAKLAPGVIPTTLPPSGSAGGDLNGSYPNPTVIKLQGVSVSNTLPLSGQVLKFDGTQWVAGTDDAGGALTLPYSSSATNAQSLLSITNQGTGAGIEGINSTGNANAFGVIGKLSSTSPGLTSAGIRGINNGTSGNGYGVWGSHNGLGTGVYGTSINGNGVHGFSTNSNGIFGSSTNYAAGYFDISNASNSSDAIYGYTTGTGSGVTVISEQGNGVWGTTFSGFSAGILGYNFGGGEAITGMTISNTSGAVVGKNIGTFAGVQGISGADNGIGVLAWGNADGTTGSNALVAEIEGAGAGNPAVFRANGSNVARIDNTGKGFFNGGTQNSGADIAEAFDVHGSINDFEAGDVLVISSSKDRAVEKSAEPYSTLVAGVFATKPGVLLTEENIDNDLTDKVPMGVIGVIPTKVCLEGGAIKRGDLLVTSSIPGVAMKADIDKVKVGQVLGKALQDFSEPKIEKINVLVSIK